MNIPIIATDELTTIHKYHAIIKINRKKYQNQRRVEHDYG